MDNSALFKLSYGLFVAGCNIYDKNNACIVNTAIQTTSQPSTMSVTMLKTNLTTDMIIDKGSMTISVIGMDTQLSVINNFGMGSGRTRDKFDGVNFEVDELGNPYIKEDMIAMMSLKVTSQIDLGTHIMFMCDVVNAKVLGDSAPMTYADYRVLKTGGTVKEKQESKKVYTCTICHYVYDGEVPFEELPDDWLCPLCKKGKSVFIAQ